MSHYANVYIFITIVATLKYFFGVEVSGLLLKLLYSSFAEKKIQQGDSRRES